MIVNHELVTRVEDAIAAERAVFANAMAAMCPGSGAGWLPVAGGRAIFTGSGFFSNRAFAMGLRGPVSRNDIERVEAFYAKYGMPSEIEIAAMVDRSLIRLLSQLGYRLVRFHNIYAQLLQPGDATLPAFRRQGVQCALIEARLAMAAQAGCDLAIVTADPGSSSGRNAERMGFQLVCTHVAMRAPGE